VAAIALALCGGGLPVNVRGIELPTSPISRNAKTDSRCFGDRQGRQRQQPRLPVPEIRVVLLDDAKHELYHWN
jgi:hypothetical protein